MVSEARGDGTGGTPFDDASGDDADDGVREALRAVDDALKFASAAWCDVESVRVLVREVAALRRMAGVEDVRFVDEDGDEVDRELRLETAWARCRVRVAEAEALALRREAEGAKEKFRETFGDDASEWLQALRVKVDVWEDEMTSRMRGLSTI
ncbi:unnamed product [Ostreococcus tauri]|uniref:Unnamed product n=1 Tax=Ostreococcus tauri TaxID=70448 RepID=Q014S9_OSTTA|nr:unnamed product [Ostreococcus tauri]CAL54600.1 unnamed product [Ostreococcus tauri]|eukprot:XP_003080433.1 unnamed product [Ostreococcus tauri]